MDSAIIYESNILKVYDSYIPRLSSHDVVLDLGAHIGTFAIHVASLHPNVTIHAFEPNPESYRLLVKNIEANHLGNRIVAHPYGVAAQAGKRQMFIPKANTGDATLGKPKDVRHVISAQFQTLAYALNLVKGKRNILLKIDAEGAEYEIIRAASPSLLRAIDWIVMETHAGYDVGVIERKLLSSGFTLKHASGTKNTWLPFKIPLLIARRPATRRASRRAAKKL